MNYWWLMLFLVVELEAQHSLRKLPHPVNTAYYNEICPVFALDEKTLFYTRVGSPAFNKTLIYDNQDLHTTLSTDAYFDRLAAIFSQIAGRQIPDPVNTSYNQDIHIALVEKDTLRFAYHPGYPLNNALPNSICSVTTDSSSFVVINRFETKGGMREGFSLVHISDSYESSFPEAITIEGFNKSAHEVNLTLSPDQQFLILAVAEKIGEQKDMYVCERIDSMHYSKPLPLWRINTQWDESTPYISRDGQKLFFASDRPGGKGAKDIYVSERQNSSPYQWLEPKALGAPVNSSFNESHPYVFKDNDRIYFTSDRDGNSDIFTARLNRSADMGKIKLQIEAYKEDGSRFPAEISWGSALDGDTIEWKGYFRSRDGRHTIEIEENKPFYIVAENRGLRTAMEVIEVQDLIDAGSREAVVRLTLKPKEKQQTAQMQSTTEEESILSMDLKPGSTTVLHHIYFEKATAFVRPESMVNIRKLAKALMRQPAIRIVIEGHTDNVGNKNDLMQLSKNRADTIRSLLIQEGVAPERVETKGYGATRPVTDNSTEEKKQQNRRVEIRVL